MTVYLHSQDLPPAERLRRLLFADPSLSLALLALGSAGVLSAAFFFQYVLGYQPCALCIYQRWPYAVVVALGLVGYAARRLLAGGGTASLLVLCALALAVDSGVAVYHVGVEQHWWAGTASCGGTAAAADSLDALRAQIMAAAIVRCDEPAWTLFGVSMAGYNVLLAAGLAGYAFHAARQALTGPKH